MNNKGIKIIRLEPSSKQCLYNLIPLRHVFLLFRFPLCKFLKLKYIYLAIVASL